MKENIAQKAKKVVEPYVISLGYVVWDVTYQKEGDEWILSVEIDGDRPIDIDDCVKVNDAIEPLIDEADLVQTAYSFQVASAGLERDLKNDSHFEYALVKRAEVNVKLFAPLNGIKSFCAVIAALSQDEIAFRLSDGTILSVPKKSIAKAHISL